MAPRFSLGIDLGTSNSAIAFCEIDGDRTEILEITQVLGPNRIGEKPTLPSALYIPHPKNFPPARSPCPGPRARTRSSASSRGITAPWCPTA